MIRKMEPAAALRDERVRLERMISGELHLSWLGEEVNRPVHIYWSPLPIFAESEARLIAEAAGPFAHSFSDPQPEGRGYFHIQLGDEMLPPVAERIVPLGSVPNFRDMGGYAGADGRRVQWGKLYRSAELARMTERDIQYARSLGIVWICDLRTPREVQRYPSPRIGGELTENLSFMASTDPEEMFAASVTGDMLADANRQMVGNTELAAHFLRRLLDQQGAPILFHCAAGKDRTGFIGSLILQALGACREDILNDYALTNRFSERLNVETSNGGDPAWATKMKELPEDVRFALMEARPAYLQAAFDEIDRKYGDFETYWTRGLGLSLEELRQLRDDYLQ
ncbi:tyrosine-protein phosphatase [Paenibacillus sanguinis]|uniref:tyrosine-protein phosphatase n=1 Tax=Paenibacillus sanguinis TaxID=225906 RepID=UPI00037E42E9|nr:tyrosine-protein phosphatase [Paenibacillus sanguinis]